MGRTIHDVEQRFPQVANGHTDESTPEGRLNSLSQRKFQVETEMKLQYEVLVLNGIDLGSPLTDSNGFPRDDIPDLASVRVARAKIHELKNDLRWIVDQLAQTLPLVLPRQGDGSVEPSPDGVVNGSSGSPMTPFAKVDMVAPNSPAELAGLKIDDQIVRFGHLNAQNHNQLKALATLVAENEGKSLNVVWFRFEEDKRRMITKTLVPRSGWGGRGLLGCHIIPI